MDCYVCSHAQVAIAQSGAIAGLVHMLQHGTPGAQVNAVEALRNLSVDAACCRQIARSFQVHCRSTP